MSTNTCNDLYQDEANSLGKTLSAYENTDKKEILECHLASYWVLIYR